MVGKDKQRCRAAGSEAIKGGTDREGVPSRALLWKPLVVAVTSFSPGRGEKRGRGAGVPQ